MAIEAQELEIQIGARTLLHPTNFHVAKGDKIGLVGRNGAGKTTVFKLITGLYPVSSGRVKFKGVDITNMSAAKRARNGLSIKMQVPGVFEELTMRENIRIAAGNYIPAAKLDEETEQLIKLVKLDKLGNPPVHNMSHGQQQWLEIAMALSSKPELLLLDEPAAGRGPEETAFTAELVNELNATGLTILFIDHDMDFVRQIAQKVTVMHYGRKFAYGTVDEISNDPGVKQIYLGNV